MSDTPSVNDLLTEALTGNNPSQPIQGPTFNLPGPRLPRNPNPGPFLLPGEMVGLVPAQTETLEQASPSVGTATPAARTAEVANAAQRNARDLAYGTAVSRYTGAGAGSRTQVEIDLATLTPAELRGKYGAEQADRLIRQNVAGANEYFGDRRQTRSMGEAVVDSAIAVPTGFVSGLGSLGALGLGLVSDDAGAWAARQNQGLSEWSRGLQSDGLQARARINEVRSRLNQEENEAIRAREVSEGTSAFTAGLRALGRGAVSGASDLLSDPMVASDAIGQGVGSLLTGSVVGRGLSALGKVLGTTAITPARGVMAAVTGLEAGGAYAGASSDIQDMSFEDLERNSADYRELVKPVSEGGQGLTSEEARIALAGSAGRIAATTQAPLALAASRLTARFEAAPTRVPSVSAAARNLATEFGEEGIQEGSGKFAQNLGVQQTGDETRSLVEGVGESAAQGAIVGMGTAGALQAPGIVGRVAGRGISLIGSGAARAAEAAGDMVSARADRVREENDASSPIGEQALTEISQQVTANPAQVSETVNAGIAEAGVPDAQQAELQEYANQIIEGAQLTERDRTDPFIPEDIRTSAADATSLMFGIANRINSLGKNADPAEQARLGISLINRGQALQAHVDLDSPLASMLPEGSDAARIVDNVQKLMANIMASPNILAAMEKAQIVLARRQAALEARLKAENQEQELTEEDAQGLAALAAVNPAQVNPDVAAKVLNQAVGSGPQLTTAQRTSLRNAYAIGKAEQAAVARAKANGHDSPLRGVSEQILAKERTDGDPGYRKSAVAHAQGVIQAFNLGALEEASDRLRDMGLFVQHMNNKVHALNEQFEKDAGLVRYQALQPNREWKLSENGLGVTIHSPNSIQFAQQVSYEADRLGAIYNHLVEAYPSLNETRIEIPSLNSALEGDVRQVAHTLRTKGRPAPQPKPKSVPPAAASTPPPTPASTTTPPAGNGKEPRAKPVSIVESELFPSLFGSKTEGVGSHLTNGFNLAYRIPAKQRTRTIGAGRVGLMVKNALKSQGALTAFLDNNKIQHELTPDVAEEYQGYLAKIPAIKGIMERRLQNFLKNNKRHTKMMDGLDLGMRPNGKFLNITDQSPDGSSFTYNQELLEGALLATLNWLIQATNSSNQHLEMKDAEAILGAAEGSLEQSTLEILKSGMHRVNMHRTLADQIIKFWGVEAPKNASIGMQKGIALSVAAEILESLDTLGVFDTQKNTFIVTTGHTDTGVPIAMPRDFNIYTIPESVLDPKSKLFEFPTAIETAVVIEPEKVRYYGDQIPKVADSQLNNPGVPNTPENKAMIQTKQKTVYKANGFMVRFIEMLGMGGAQELFGAGNLEGKAYNDQHKKSLEGVNRSIGAAVNTIIQQVAEMKNIAGEEGYLDLAVRYALNVTSVGRLQMLGGYNPQSTKMLREVFLSTWSTLDMTGDNPKHKALFNLALAQALGIKVHKEHPSEITKKLNTLLTDTLAPVVEVMETLQRDDEALGPKEIETIKAAFAKAKEPVTPLAIHALSEYAKLKRANADELKAFRTSLYVEADGMTNGVVNAMAMLTSGGFTKEWVENMAKGGLSFDPNIKTSNDYYGDEKARDIYETSKDFLDNILKANRELFATSKGGQKLANQQDLLIKLMAMMLPDITLNADGTITLKRGLTKNPLTITLYGSGKKGIAGKMMGLVMDEVHARMSLWAEAERIHLDRQGDASTKVAMSNQEIALAVFGSDVDGDPQRAMERFKTFQQALNGLTSNSVEHSKNGLWLKEHRFNVMNIKPKTFQLGFQLSVDKTASADEQAGRKRFNEMSRQRVENFQKNMLTLFVGPMHQAIVETVGDTLIQNATLIQKATQAQSIVLEHLFKDAVRKVIAKKQAEDPTYLRSSFLSQDELDQVLEDLNRFAPTILGQGQRFYVSASDQSNFDKVTFGTDGGGNWKTGSYVWGPQDSGVRGIPLLNIGYGDAQMIQIYATDPNTPTNDLPIFDGINIALDQLEDGAALANKAVWQSWQGNPLGDVYKSFSTFQKNFSGAMLTEEMLKHFGQVLLSEKERKAGLQVSSENVMLYFRSLEGHLQTAELSVRARHNALKRVQTHIEQMAAAQSPYLANESGQILIGSSEEIATSLDVFYQEELTKLTKSKEAANAKAPSIPKHLGNDVRKVGAQEIGMTVLAKTLRTLALSDTQRAVVGEILKGKALQGYKAVIGTPESILDYQVAAGLEHVSVTSDGKGGTIEGSISIAEKRIYLPSNKLEPLVHELIHAATFERVLSVFEGKPHKAEDVTAVKRIRELMKQFLEMGGLVLDESLQTQEAYENAVRAIGPNWNSPDSVDQAKALNEFMAWAMANKDLTGFTARATTNKDLAGLLKETSVFERFKQFMASVLDRIKALLFGSKKLAKPTEDMFSNLLLNSAVLMRGQPSVAEQVQEHTLHMSKAFGSSERLVGIQQTFNELINKHLNVGGVQEQRRRWIKAEGVIQARELAQSAQVLGFNMNAQEQSVFESIVTALAIDTQLEPSTLVEMEKLYQHTIQQMDQDSFRQNDDPQDQADSDRSRIMYGVLAGTHGSQHRDTKGRNHILPVFFGLAVVNDEFRQILLKLEMPKGALESKKQTLDSRLSNLGMSGLEKLSEYLSGADRDSPNVRAALDTLTEHIQEIAAKKTSFINQYSSVVGNQVDKLNAVVVEGMNYAADWTLDKLTGFSQRVKNPYARVLLGSAQIMAAVASKSKSEEVAEGVISQINKIKGFEPMRELLSDLVGRTKSNAKVLDMLKAVRTMVQQQRQNFRKEVPKHIASKFKIEPTKAQWTALFKAMGKTDMAALFGSMSRAEVLEMLTDLRKVNGRIRSLESSLEKLDPAHFSLVQQKAKQLARFMNTGEYGSNLLRNATAVAQLLGEVPPDRRGSVSQEVVSQVDQLITLYALKDVSAQDWNMMVDLIRDEPKGMDFVLAYLVGQRKVEQDNATGMALLNHYKGYVHSEQAPGMTLIVADDKEFTNLRLKSFVRVADYAGSKAEGSGVSRGYYMAPVNSRAAFNQGIFQNVRLTAGGVDVTTGRSHSGNNAGFIDDPKQVALISRRLRFEGGTKENLLPVFDGTGVLKGYERALDPAQIAKLQHNTQLHEMLGAWAGRQVEEESAQQFNAQLIQNLHAMWDMETVGGSKNNEQYVNTFDPQQADNVVWDAQSLLNRESVNLAQRLFGEGKFYVRKDMLNDALGYRKASVGDMWTGNSRYSPQTQRVLKNLLVSTFGNDAYARFVNGEEAFQNIVKSAKEMIIIKSVIVPMANFGSNLLQLIARGVPVVDILRGVPRKTAEIDLYVRGQLEIVELDAELRAAHGNPAMENKLKARIASIQDTHKRLSIWPLIARGEFSSITDAGLVQDDALLTKGKIMDYIGQKVEQLPQGVRTAGRYAWISKDTALFRGLQKSVAYGDFIAKAIMYDDLITRQNKSQADALGQISEEYVNYDKLPGRSRGYLEDMGLLWFYNFKIRSVKVAMSIVRNNPVHALIATMLPVSALFNGVELPTEENLISKIADGGIFGSVGYGQGMRSPMLHPMVNIAY